MAVKMKKPDYWPGLAEAEEIAQGQRIHDEERRSIIHDEDCIRIHGAREHNLKNIDVTIPRNELIVLTGLSGSGKSSLAFDTIYAEGQRRYMESLSSYARQFLGQMEKPDVDQIDGLSPAISIDQKSTNRNPRSTVGTVTEIYDYFRLLYARIGTPHCPDCGRVIEKQTVDQMVDRVLQLPERTRILVLAPVVRGKKGRHEKVLERARRAGYVRVRVDGSQYDISDEEVKLDKNKKHSIEIVVDRLSVRAGIESRLADSLENALNLAEGLAQVQIVDGGHHPSGFAVPSGRTESGDSLPEAVPGGRNPESGNAASPTDADMPDAGAETASMLQFSQSFACPDCGLSIPEIEPRSFSFNNPFGACPDCAGLGYRMEFDPKLIIPDERLSINEGAIAVVGWQSCMKEGSWTNALLRGIASRYHFSLDTPWQDLPETVRAGLMDGFGSENFEVQYKSQSSVSRVTYRVPFEGILENTRRRYRETGAGRTKEEFESFMDISPCLTCEGRRLKRESLAVTVGGQNIYDVTCLSIRRLRSFLDELQLTRQQQLIGEQILKEIRARVAFLNDVGLDYLSLSRATATLSGGEAQRIRLATQIGSGLVGVCYILDEPSIGLHQRDNDKLLRTLKSLRDLWNTVIVVEHDEDTMRAADYIVDIGPGAGSGGGEVVACGTAEEIMACPASITGQYLSGKRCVPVPSVRREPTGWLTVHGAAMNNLKHIEVKIPLGVLCLVTGVSGSGKSSLVNEILYKQLARDLNHARTVAGPHDGIEGMEQLDKVINIDQSPIGRTPRSNPATYTGVFDLIRDLFAGTPDAKARGYTKGRFSFNVKGGRCEACAGDGIIKIEMHFLPDVYVPCEVCGGKRYNRETLEVKYKGKSIYDVLDMTIEEAVGFFENVPQIRNRIRTLYDVGLGYVKLGQPSTELSGGEAQRIKLAAELSRRSTGRTIYILDEPTTGLHFEDVRRLTQILQKLVEGGNSVIVIEHNLDVIKTADYIIDMGPEGGDGGGTVVACGTPEEIAQNHSSYTGYYVHKALEKARTDSAAAAESPGL